jgi:hypothetical protein
MAPFVVVPTQAAPFAAHSASHDVGFFAFPEGIGVIEKHASPEVRAAVESLADAVTACAAVGPLNRMPRQSAMNMR